MILKYANNKISKILIILNLLVIFSAIFFLFCRSFFDMDIDRKDEGYMTFRVLIPTIIFTCLTIILVFIVNTFRKK